MDDGNTITARLLADLATLLPCPACPEPARVVKKYVGMRKERDKPAQIHSISVHRAKLTAHQQALDALIARLPGQAFELAQVKRAWDGTVQRLEKHMERAAGQERQRSIDSLASHTLDSVVVLAQGLEAEVGAAASQHKRATAVQNWSRARRLLRTQSACEKQITEATRQQNRHRMHIEMLRRLTAARAVDVDTLVAELSTVRERLETVTAAEDRFIARQQYEDLRARLEDLQAETATLGQELGAALRVAAGLRTALAALTSAQPDTMAETLQARAARALQASTHFERLFSAGNFEEAAAAAAASPEGVLRTPQVWARFRAAALAPTASTHRWSRRALARTRLPQEPTARLAGGPLLLLCAAVAAHAPTQEESLWCVAGAIDCRHWDLVAHWLAQEMLQSSVALADLLVSQCSCPSTLPCRCRPAALALVAREQAGDVSGTVRALLRQGRVASAFARAAQEGWTPAALLPHLLDPLHPSALFHFARMLFLAPTTARPAIEDPTALMWAASHLAPTMPLSLPPGPPDAVLAQCLATAAVEVALL